MASNLDLSKLTLTEPHSWETNSTSYRSASSVASGVSFSLVNKSRASPNHTNWARGPLKKFIINFVIAQKLAPLGTEWAKLYDEHPELYGLPRFTLPALQCNRRTIITEHMTIRPSATLLSQFYPVPVWEELPDDHPACETTSLTVVQAVSTALYEEYLEACAAWETTARMAIRQHTVDTIVTASREIPNDTSVLSDFRLVPRSVRYRLPGSRITRQDGVEGPAHESENLYVKVEKWLHGVFGWHGFEIPRLQCGCGCGRESTSQPRILL